MHCHEGPNEYISRLNLPPRPFHTRCLFLLRGCDYSRLLQEGVVVGTVAQIHARIQ